MHLAGEHNALNATAAAALAAGQGIPKKPSCRARQLQKRQAPP
jgi:UDP-N-acetylmuramate-alanine ligase